MFVELLKGHDVVPVWVNCVNLMSMSTWRYDDDSNTLTSMLWLRESISLQTDKDRHEMVTHLHVGSKSGADLRPRLLVVDTSTIDVAFLNGVCPALHWEEGWELRGTIQRVIKSLVVTRP